MKNKILIILSFLISITISLPSYWENELSKPETSYIPNEVIVKYKNNPNTKNITTKNLNELKLNNLKIKDKSEENQNLILLEINDNKSVEETISILKGNPNIEYAEPNYIRYFFWMNEIDTNDTLKNYQKSLELISRPEAYNQYSWFFKSNTFSWVTIWIIDNWVNYNHPELINSMWNQTNCIVDWENNYCEHWYDFFHNTSTPLPNSNGHWTHIAWIIAAEINNWKWIIWVNPYAKIASLKVWGSESLTSYDEIRAINFAIGNWIKIINASFWSETFSEIEKEVIKEFWDNWWLFITAAGNGDSNNNWINIDLSEAMYPCSYNLDNIICVAATDNYWDLATYSNYWTSSVDIAAPWYNIYSTIITWVSIQNIYSEYFSGCNQRWESLNYRKTWGCYQRYDDDTFWYYFYDKITSPSINLEGNAESQLSVSIICSATTDIWIEFSNNNTTYTWVDTLWQISSRRFTMQIPEEYSTENFSFKLRILNWATEEFCVIDDIEIYQDPYIQWDDNVYWRKTWTSMATPHVVWLASLIMMINPTLSFQDIKNIIIEYGDSKPSLSGKLVSGKMINIKNSLDYASIKDISTPTWLDSSWSWDITRNLVEWVNNYHYEIYNTNEDLVDSWTTNTTWVSTQLQWNYTRKVKWIDILWNESDFSSYYICEKPNYWDTNLSTRECSSLSWISIPNDPCSNSYKIIFTWNNVSWEITNDKPWNITETFYIENSFGERTENFHINYSWTDTLPTININNYTYTNTITTTNPQNIWNFVNIFWVNDGACWSDTITTSHISCTKGTANLSKNNLTITAPTSENWTWNCIITFSDDEGNTLSWLITYTFNTIQTNNWWGGWGWGGWGWWWGGGWNNTKTETTTNSSVNSWETISTTWDSNSWLYQENDTLEKPRILKLLEKSKEDEINKSRYEEWDQSEKLSNWYTREFNNAYRFAYINGITTMSDISKADMYWKLTRIAMAKMLSNYAINVLGKETTNTIVPQFSDITKELNDNYWWAIDSAYQLWIMWIWINKFRPYDEVTRAEFATALSRILYSTPDGQPYYSTHLKKLTNEWIITNNDPNIKELRWYIMIMLMRSATK